jgi:putative ABC transport system ATP-binding protein
VTGKDVAKLPERFLTRVRRDTFGFIFQQFNLIRDLSVLENVLLPLYPLKTPIGEMRQRGEEALARLGIQNKSSLKVRQLSGGEQQRVAIARALINDPQIIIADEPTAHLDSKLSADLLDIIGEINRLGKTILIATHDPLVYEHSLVKRTIVMKDGRVEGVSLK